MSTTQAAQRLNRCDFFISSRRRQYHHRSSAAEQNIHLPDDGDDDVLFSSPQRMADTYLDKHRRHQMSDQAGNDLERDPTVQKDFSKPWNQLRPRSMKSSGLELDAGCEITTAPSMAGMDTSTIPTSDVGKMGYDKTMKFLDAGRKPNRFSASLLPQNNPVKSGLR